MIMNSIDIITFFESADTSKGLNLISMDSTHRPPLIFEFIHLPVAIKII